MFHRNRYRRNLLGLRRIFFHGAILGLPPFNHPRPFRFFSVLIPMRLRASTGVIKRISHSPAHSGGTKLLPSHIGKLECLAPPRATQPACEAFFAPYERAAYPALLLPTPARLLHLHNFLLAAFQTHEPRYATYPISLNCIRRAIISDSPHAIRATSMPR